MEGIVNLIALIAPLVAFYYYQQHKMLLKALSERNTITPEPPNWLRRFALYYLASELNHYPNDDRGHLILMLNNKTNLSLEQSMLAELQIYLKHEYKRNRTQDDYKQALKFTAKLLREEFAYRSSPIGMKHFIRGLLLKEGKESSEAKVTFEFQSLMAFIKETGDATRPLFEILKECFNDMFQAQFGKSFSEYNREIIH